MDLIRTPGKSFPANNSELCRDLRAKRILNTLKCLLDCPFEMRTEASEVQVSTHRIMQITKNIPENSFTTVDKSPN